MDLASRTVVCARRGADDYVLFTFDLDALHAWGDRGEMLKAGVPSRAVDLAARIGSAKLTEPISDGHYPWAVSEIQYGDWMIDRERAVEFCEALADEEDPDINDFTLGMASWRDEDDEGAGEEFEAPNVAFTTYGLSQMAADLGITDEMVKGGLPNAEGFINAAWQHDLPYAAGLLELAGGDADRAWQLWAAEAPDL